MAARSSYITNEIIITAMDRFVWFVILIVMSHLVTEFTRVTGYTSGTRNEQSKPLNDSSILGRQVQNLVLLPGQEYSTYYQQPASSQYSVASQNAPVVVPPAANNQQGFIFSLRPLIDSIFEIPISTLRAVNNLVSRLTGSYQQPTAPSPPSVAPGANAGPSFSLPFITLPRSAAGAVSAKSMSAAAAATATHTSNHVDATPIKPVKRTLMRELSA